MGIYLDYNASTPIDQRVLDVMIDVYQNKYGNADSRTHDYGRQHVWLSKMLASR